MVRAGSRWLGVFVTALSFTMPSAAEAQDLRADMQMSGGALPSPAAGALYVSGSAARIEVSMDGQEIIILGDPIAGSMNILMPDQGVYMPLSAGMSPVSVPPVSGYNPADPCSSGQVTNCVSLGPEQVNGYDTAGWQYDSNGETWSAWISTELSFPVRLVGSDGTTTDFTNIAMGPQDPSLFEIPSNYQAMGGFGGFAGGGGGGAPGGAPSGDAGGGFGFPPGFDPASFGVDPSQVADQLADLQAATDAYDADAAAQWESGDGWMVSVTVTASGERTLSDPTILEARNESTESYSIELRGSFPLNYGAPGVPGSAGPRWQLIPGIGSDRGNAAQISFSAESAYQSDGSHVAECSIVDGPNTWTRTTRGLMDWNLGPATSDNMAAQGVSFYWQIAPDLQTYELMIGVAGEATETTEGVTNYGPCPPDPVTSEPINETAARQYTTGLQITGEPLPSARGTVTGSRTMPLQFNIGGFSGELDATVEWTLSPI